MPLPKPNLKNEKKYSLTLVLIIIALFGGYLLGKNTVQTTNGTPAPSSITNTSSTKADLTLFWDVWNKIESDYVDKPKINSQQMAWGAISGMVKSLGDPYTVFLTPEENKKFSDDISGSFEGIGAEIGIRKGTLVIVAPLEGTPAKSAGLMANDKILKINDKVTQDMSVEEAVSLIRGPKDTEVTLTIFRDSWDQTKEFKIKRKTIQIPIVKLTFKDNNKIAYLQLFHFTENSASEFKKAVDQIVATKAKGIILDLRDNPGGYLDSSVEIASHFLKKNEPIVTESFNNGKQDEYKSLGYNDLGSLPIVVLTNQGSASASEILAGALRDDKKAQLIGEKTYGKGSVQELLSLAGNSSLKITIAKWFTPSGKSINDEGLVPDIEIKMTEQDVTANKDPQLDKALSIISSLIK